MPTRRPLLLAALATLAVMSAGARATDDLPEHEDWTARFQTTYIVQKKSGFSAAYSGQNSLTPSREKSYSFTASAALGFRPWAGGEFYANPEVAQGVPLSNLTGLGGFSNGEMARTSGPEATFYRARLFLRQTWGYGSGSEALAADMNQLAGSVDKHRLVLTAGNLSVLDIFDKNTYNHDARTQFMNWSLMTHGAYDYAADARGYSWGAVLEYFHDDWAIRAGRFIQPEQPNQKSLDEKIFQHYGDQIELERAHSLNGQPGKLRVLYFRNRAVMRAIAMRSTVARRPAARPTSTSCAAANRSSKGSV